MAQVTFTKATKEQARLRLALFGPSGSGKTFTALRLATGMGGRIAVIDTERGSASKYADRFEFDVLELGNDNRSTDGYIAGIKAAQQAAYNILIIDSLSHAWKELLQEVDRLASKFGGNKWAAWSKGTPKQNSFVDAILDYDGHIIATMRSKTAWDTSKDARGRATPVRVGLEPVQGKGIEYEFDLLGELSIDHVLHISKDRTGKFQDRTIEKPGEDIGKELMAWLSSGAPTTKRKQKDQKKVEKKPLGAVAQAAVEDFGATVITNDTAPQQLAAMNYKTPKGARLGELTPDELVAISNHCVANPGPMANELLRNVELVIDHMSQFKVESDA